MESVSRISSIMDPGTLSMDSSWLHIADPPHPVRDLTVEAASAAAFSKALKSSSSSRNIPSTKLKALLDSRSDRDILDGLKKVVSV